MSDRVTIFDEPKRYLDEEEVFDVIDDLRRHVIKLKKTIVELKEGNREMGLLLDIEGRQIRDLKSGIIKLRGIET